MGKSKLLESVRRTARVRRFSIHTERAYCRWIVRFIRYHDLTHPRHLDARDLTDFLSYLANERRVAASTQNQARSALLFLFRDALGRNLELIDAPPPAKRPARLPVVLTREEVRTLLAAMKGTNQLIAQLLYSCGLRLREALTLRVKDLYFERNAIHVVEGKGRKDRYVPLPQKAQPGLKLQLERARHLHEKDLADGHGSVYLPNALSRKFPNAAYE